MRRSLHLPFEGFLDQDGHPIEVTFEDKVNIAVAIELFRCRWKKSWNGDCRSVVGPDWFRTTPDDADANTPLCGDWNRYIKNWAASDAVADVVREMKKRGWFFSCSEGPNGAFAMFAKPNRDGVRVVSSQGHRQETNICLAALKARGINLESEQR